MMKIFSAALLLLAVLAFPASALKFEFKVTAGEQTYVKRVELAPGQQLNLDERLDSQDGESRRRFIFNLFLSPEEGPAGRELSLQFESGAGSTSDNFQLQTSVKVSPGQPLMIARCGGHSVRVTLAGRKTRPGDPSQRVVAVEEGGQRCAAAVQAGSQMNVIGRLPGGRRALLNAVLTKASSAGASVDYQLELSGGGKAAVQDQGSAVLAPGAKKGVKGAALRADPVK